MHCIPPPLTQHPNTPTPTQGQRRPRRRGLHHGAHHGRGAERAGGLLGLEPRYLEVGGEGVNMGGEYRFVLKFPGHEMKAGASSWPPLTPRKQNHHPYPPPPPPPHTNTPNKIKQNKQINSNGALDVVVSSLPHDAAPAAVDALLGEVRVCFTSCCCFYMVVFILLCIHIRTYIYILYIHMYMHTSVYILY